MSAATALPPKTNPDDPSRDRDFDYPPSYYAATVKRDRLYPPLQSSETIDVAVIGAGFTGLSAALELAKRGLSVRLIEKSQIGFGASGRNGGQVTPGYSKGLSNLLRLLSPDEVRIAWNYSVEAVNLVKTRIEEYKIECDVRPGVIAAAIIPGHMAELRRDQALLVKLCQDYNTVIWDRQRLVQSMTTPRYIGAGQDLRSFAINPLKYCLGLAAAAAAAGVKIAEQTAITRIEGDGLAKGATRGRTRGATGGISGKPTSPYRLHCRSFDPAHPSNPPIECIVSAHYVVSATNGYGVGLVPPMNGLVMPVASIIMATKPMAAQLAEIYPGQEAVADCNFILDYFRPTIDGRLLFGGRANYNGKEPVDIAAALMPRLAKVFPQLKSVTVDYAWGGLIAISRLRLPQYGKLGAGFYYAQGYSGQGIALANHAGMVLAKAIANESDDFNLMKKWPQPRFPGGGRFRTPLLTMGMLWHSLKDAK
ncbi:MAG: FAD-dependent oxidoreductase [Candidatus Symbiobacter sp.]|nr:FAD-dependent oxidoreductase [Candidatus Symbiobacter sp.]